MPLRHPALTSEAPYLGLDLADDVVQALQIGGRAVESPLRDILAASIEANASRLLEERAAFLWPIGQQAIDHLCFDDHARIAPQSRTLQDVHDVAESNRRLVEQVLALAAPGQAAGDHDLVERDGQDAIAVVEDERDLGDVDRSAFDGSVKDHFVHTC